jgi:hypothetical protein
MGGLALEHGADLHGGGVRAQQVFLRRGFLGDVAETRRLREVEGVLRVARGVVGGRAERVKAVILRLDLGALDDGEAGLAEDAAHLLAHEGERMRGARPGVRRRERGIDGGPELGGDFGVGDALQGGVELGRELGLGLVDELAHGRALLLRHGAHLLHQGGEFAVRTDVTGPWPPRSRRASGGPEVQPWPWRGGRRGWLASIFWTE